MVEIEMREILPVPFFSRHMRGFHDQRNTSHMLFVIFKNI